MRQCRWIELFSDYDCEICYPPGKANVVADALSRKEKVKPNRVRAINMTLQPSIKNNILVAQKEAFDESDPSFFLTNNISSPHGDELGRMKPLSWSTFTLNDHYATTLFNSGVDYSFVSTTFIPLLGIEPSDLGFSYEIEIASGKLVEIDKVIRG
uniref:Putative reverse transcriptase domain-containing protein n=1 Tax=Tanacetum cinerariifolium TaxID=118510 RepID=A0A699KHN6_TANCI|nr:putative reverse transcriptase domain-containing protein [Tanacetum cinerariifolium]